MKSNEILKKCQDILGVDDDTIYKIFISIDDSIPKHRVYGYLKDRGDKDFLDCGYAALGTFLDGLILYKRGDSYKKVDDDVVVKLTNNLILKKLRIAFNLKDADMYEIFHLVDIDITKSELSSLFRSESHKKFRYCPDSILILFLDGLKIYQTKL